MKHISDLVIFDNNTENLDKAQKHKTSVFVSSVYSLFYADTDVKKIDGISAMCLQYHDTINKFSDTEYQSRLDMIKSICAVPKMPGLYGSYRNAVEALRIACGELCNITHDYHLVVPRSYATGELQRIKEREKNYTEDDRKKSLQNAANLKKLFD